MTLNELIAQKACELDNLILLRTILESGDCNVCRKRKFVHMCRILGNK